MSRFKKGMIITFVSLALFSLGMLLIASVGIDGVHELQAGWINGRAVFIFIKYLGILSAFIYYKEIVFWIAKKRNNQALFDGLMSKKHMFFIPVVAIELLRIA